MACVVSKHCFGGGIYSTTHSKLLRMVGKGQRQLAEVAIKKRGRGMRLSNGVFRAKVHPSYMPKRLTEPWHPGGNSLCYQIQLAHLMDCYPIYALAFTLQSGTPYHFGRTNPVTRRTSFYDAEVPMLWLSWYESQWPGRVRLLPGWSGPVYDVFKTEALDDGTEQRALRPAGFGEDGASPEQPDPDTADGALRDVERFRQDRGDQPIHADGEQPQGDESPSVRPEGEEEGGSEPLRSVPSVNWPDI